MRPDQVRVLRDRTEGWAAGVRLAVLSVDPGDVDGGIERFSGNNRSVAEYLVGEVLARLSPQDRDFLLKTSVVDRISGEPADHLTGRGDGQLVLERLLAGNVFVVALGDAQRMVQLSPTAAGVAAAPVDAGTAGHRKGAAPAGRAVVDRPGSTRRRDPAADPGRGCAGRGTHVALGWIDDPVRGRTPAGGGHRTVGSHGIEGSLFRCPARVGDLASAPAGVHGDAPDTLPMPRKLPDLEPDVRPSAELVLALLAMMGPRATGNSANVVALAARAAQIVQDTPARGLLGAHQYGVIARINLAG